MARPALRPADIEEFRRRVCDVALREFAHKGYRAVTLRGIARELGCSHALAYRYFAGKAAIFVAVRRRCLDRFIAFQERRLRELGDPSAALRAGARSYLDFAFAEPRAFAALFELDQPQPRARDAGLREAHRRAFRILERVVRRALDAGLIVGEPAELTRTFWSAIHGVAALQLAGQLASRRAAYRLAQGAADALIRGFAAREASP